MGAARVIIASCRHFYKRKIQNHSLGLQNYQSSAIIRGACARSEVGLSRLPVTEEIAGSNPVERATVKITRPIGEFFIYLRGSAGNLARQSPNLPRATTA